MDRRKLKISPKLIGAVMLILAIIIGVTAWINAGNIKGYEDTEIAVCLEGEEMAKYTIDEMSQMGAVSVYAEFTSKKSTGEKGTWTGVWVCELLEKSGVKEGEYETIVFSAGDGYSSAAEKDEAASILISWEKDGESLEAIDDGGTGPMRCVFTHESFGQRSIHNVVKIDCKK